LLGFHGPGSQMWHVNREAVLLGAGPAALLLQIAHPAVAEGVAAHSDFPADAFGRLRRTLRTTLDMIFGDGVAASAAVERLNRVHAGIRGDIADEDGRRVLGASSYRALDPDLLLWVQATLVVTSVRAYRAWVGPLSTAECERLWAEARSVGQHLGIPMAVSPPTWPALLAWFEDQLRPGGPISVTPTARRLAPAIARPPLPIMPGWAVDLLMSPGLALLPPRLRVEFGLPWPAGRAAAANLLARGLRAWVAMVPRDWRAMPPARAAERRVAAGR
jgi:uncharacterized protein (DUF2236 family)